MARSPPVNFPDNEYNAFEVSQRFTPPFYIKTLQGVYEKEENSSYSAEQVYAILHEVKIKSVIAAVGGTRLKIPLDYEGRFSIVGQHNSPLNMREITERYNLETSSVEVRISDWIQHKKHFQDTIDNIGRGIRTCNLKLVKETTDEYFVGRSPDDYTMVVFSTDANVMFQAKAANAQEVQFFSFSEKALKYDIFVTDVRVSSAIKFFTSDDAISLPPKRPPKPRPSVKPPAEKSVTNSRKQSKRQSDKEFVQSFHKGGKDVHILLSSDQPPLPPKNTSGSRSPRRKTPPPLPVHPHPNNDDDDFDGVLAPSSGSPRFPPSYAGQPDKRTPPLSPRPNDDDVDTDDEYNAKLTEATSKVDDSDSGHDYEQPISDGDDYEQVGEPMLMSDGTRRRYANLSSSPKSPISIKKTLGQLTNQIRRLKTPKTSSSGDMADDELTEDPYAEQKQDQQRKTCRKYTRHRNDPLPTPVVSPLSQTSPSIASLPHTSSLSPIPSGVSHEAMSAVPYASTQQTPDSDSDSLSDYEQINDDIQVHNIPRRPFIPTPQGSSSTKSSQHVYPQPIQTAPQSPKPFQEPLRVILPSKGFIPDSAVSSVSHQITLPDKPQNQRPKTSNHPENVAVVQPAQKPKPSSAADGEYEFPTDLCNLGVEGIAKALQHLKIPDETIGTFREAQIDGQIFVCLDDPILDDLGVNGFHKLKIIRFKNGWRPNLD